MMTTSAVRAKQHRAEATSPEPSQRPVAKAASAMRQGAELEPPANRSRFGIVPGQIRNVVDYQRDVLERTILFWDTLRQRANNMLEHERAGLPPLLNFKYETLLDARQFEQPANYAL